MRMQQTVSNLMGGIATRTNTLQNVGGNGDDRGNRQPRLLGFELIFHLVILFRSKITWESSSSLLQKSVPHLKSIISEEVSFDTINFFLSVKSSFLELIRKRDIIELHRLEFGRKGFHTIQHTYDSKWHTLLDLSVSNSSATFGTSLIQNCMHCSIWLWIFSNR